MKVLFFVKTLIYKWAKENIVMFINTGSLVGTTAITSILGFVYWWVAARIFPPTSVGLASATISAMVLLGTVSILGLGTMLIGELPRQKGNEGSLICTALLIVGCVGGCCGVIFSIVVSFSSADFQILRASIANIVMFAIAVGFTAIVLVVDEALIGLLRSDLRLWRNTIFAAAKLAAIFIASLWLSSKTGMTVFITWTVGNILSLVALLALVIIKQGGWRKVYRPQWKWLGHLGPEALQHHVFNLTLQAPSLVLPILVTVMLSAVTNAWFYVSMGIADLSTAFPLALTIVLFAESSAQSGMIASKAKLTLSLAFITGLLTVSVLLLGAEQILGLFGQRYANEAAWCLRILALMTFPLIIKDHYVAVCRIQRRVGSAILPIITIAVLQLICAAVGAWLSGLLGLSLGVLAAECIGALFLLPTVYETLLPKDRFVPTQNFSTKISVWLTKQREKRQDECVS